MKNDAASVCNFAPGGVVVYSNGGQKGRTDYSPPKKWQNLTQTYNQNASGKWV